MFFTVIRVIMANPGAFIINFIYGIYCCYTKGGIRFFLYRRFTILIYNDHYQKWGNQNNDISNGSFNIAEFYITANGSSINIIFQVNLSLLPFAPQRSGINSPQ
jgi:hypothetical protein